MARINFLPPWVETNLQPAFYDLESGTCLQQTARMYDKVNQLVRSVNDQNETIDNYIEQYNELHDYVYDYFDNLDVQEEINHKIDLMIANGTFQALLNNYVQPMLEALDSKIDDEITERVAEDNRLRSRISALASGSPLVASSTSEMTDTDRVYVNTTNGYWYYYDGDSWEQGGVYQSSVDPDEITALQGDYNLLYKGEKEVYVDTQGNWEHDGSPHDTSRRICSQITYVNANSSVEVDFGTLDGRVVYWAGSVSSDNYTDTGATWLTGTFSETFPEDGYMAIVCRKSDETSLLPSDFDGEVLIKQLCILDLDYETKHVDLTDTTFTTFSEVKNLYNPNDEDIVADSEVDYNGNVTTYAQLQVSGYIPCTAGDVLTFPVYTNHFGTGSSVKYISTYNASKEFVRSVLGVLSGSFLTLTIPSGYNIAYIRVNVGRDNTNSNFVLSPYHSHSNFMVVTGYTMPDKFIPYGGQPVLDSNIYSGHEDINNPLYGKKAIFLGDSICEGGGSGVVDPSDLYGDKQSGWAGRIGSKNTMLWVNEAIGGSTICTLSGSKTICTKTILEDNPDYIIFEGGTNDADRIGSIIGGTIPAEFGTFSPNDYGTDDSATYYGFDIDTYCGAFDYLCKRLISEYPGVKIGYIVAQKMGIANDYSDTGNNRRAYFEYAMAICKKWGIPYLNLWDNCYLNPKIKACYTSGDPEHSLYEDGQHLLAKGYNYISPIIEAWMKTL